MSYSCLNTSEGFPWDNCWILSSPLRCSFLVPLLGVSVTEHLATPPWTNFYYSLYTFWFLFCLIGSSFSSLLLCEHCPSYERCPSYRPRFHTISFFFILLKVFHFYGKGSCLCVLNSHPHHQLSPFHCTPKLCSWLCVAHLSLDLL